MPSFENDAKCHQSCFRKTSESISEPGRSPSDSKGKPYKYMLALGCEDENLYPLLRCDDGARKFFAERDIKWWSHNGFDSAGRNGPTRNMASSQIMCANFLLPLTEIDGALTAAVRAIDDDVKGIVPIEHDGRTSPVELEWIGLEKFLGGQPQTTRGQNSTSVDAFIIAETDAVRRAYLIEWKYTESYSRGVSSYKGKGSAGRTRRDNYTSIYCAKTSSFSGAVPMEELLYEPFYQLMRLRLLADRMVASGELGVTDAKVIVVVPHENAAYKERNTSPPLRERFPDLRTVSNVFRATLKEPDKTFATVSPSLLLESVERECGAAVSDWATYMRERYGL